MANIYNHWETKFIQDKYKNLKYWGGVFRSEQYFWEKIGRGGMRVLDVGCATGNLFHALRERFGEVEYVGVDGSESLVKRANELTNEATFINKNIFELDKNYFKEKFDVVVATGVFQHEPRYKELMDLMLDHAKEGGHILFDIKLFHTNKTLDDIDDTYGDHGDHRVYYIILKYQDFLATIKRQINHLAKVEIFGYYAGVNSTVRLPKKINEEVCSSHVLLQKKKDGDRPFLFSLNLPKEFIEKII